MKKSICLSLLIIMFSYYNIQACTTAIVSGKYTKDGRPILWKHRDSDFIHNKLMYFTDGKYEYIGLVNSSDLEGKEVWTGTNANGFSIMNAALYDVNLHDTTDYKDKEGFLMKMALQQCATIDDFEKLLNTLPKPLGIAASFGVIDAQGGAAYYETDNSSFIKYDANDSRIAPNGYIIRTNYSYRGEKDKGFGYIRYENAHDHFNLAFASNTLDYKVILQDFDRSFYHSLLKIDYRENDKDYNQKVKFINAEDLIVRNSSVASVLIHGVKKGESPDYTTMWTILGFQYTSVAIPAWVKGGSALPKILTSDKTNNAPLCEASLELKKKCYPIERGSGYKYLNICAVINSDKTGILQKIEPIEKSIFVETDKKVSTWQKQQINNEEIQKFYTWIDNYIIQEYKKAFPDLEIKISE
ncbi:MAG: hypothetical protein A2W99_13050 [Bacteroidetes bacterium GWF2_33_16]|nr:MAG: hypothetical protein A2X00_01225 [Bacteroidetes bacterium GWE2_32_14]OFY06608.1 MAG: hypothetical protein A2W99_13050 [Bacteroidetes bacterium GWF2_33_16]